MEGLSDIIDQTRVDDEFVSYHHHAQHFLPTGIVKLRFRVRVRVRVKVKVKSKKLDPEVGSVVAWPTHPPPDNFF